MRYLIFLMLFYILSMTGLSEGAGRKISEMGNRHNFSYTNISVNYRANIVNNTSSQICVFCHTPHRSSGEGPLWNRKSTVVNFFKHYSSGSLAIDDPAVRGVSEYGQPNGSSRLCLSCHDGQTALGAVFTTAGSLSAVNISFIDVKGGRSGQDIAISYQTFSSHHPVSFKYNAAVRTILQGAPYYKSEYVWNQAVAANSVKLDTQERMQCTTCHDPHQDKSDNPGSGTPFWVYKSYNEVCLTCHNVVPQSW